MTNSCEPGELWVPGKMLDKEFLVPSNEELTAAWSEYLGEEAFSLEGVYGTYRALGSVAAVASVDLCEVVRESAWLVDRVYGLEPTRRSHYKNGTWVEDADFEFERATTTPIVQAAMNADLMEPDADIDEIVSIIRNWRENDVYVTANTSTLPGCELATINFFLTRYMKDCFDALVLPRNHDGTGSVTKAMALAAVAKEVGFDEMAIPLVKIDDAVHHIDSFVSFYENHDRKAFFIPSHAGNTTAPEELITPDSLTAFELADDFFRKQGVLG